MSVPRWTVAAAALWMACTARPPEDSASTDTGETGSAPVYEVVDVTVTLDGSPVADAWVGIGGGGHTTTDALGRATLSVDGGDFVVASHPEARTGGRRIDATELAVPLQRFDPSDNPAYRFQDPGIAGDPGTTAQCGHCHGAMVTDWTRSPHRGAASNAVVHDIFAGTASLADATACEAAGGTWREGLEPGTGAPVDRCYLGSGTLPDLNEDCGTTTSCDGQAANTGGCADCHAPGIDGALGGRDLLDATGLAYTEGVHCDVCHKVEAVDLSRPPGVGGALHLVRPSEPSPSPTTDWQHLTFGPNPDVPNPRMGNVPRPHFREATLCAGCHELVQAAQIPGQSLDAARWPDGLPVHSTYSEWSSGPYSPASPCQSCHMPPETRYWNSADLDADTPFIDHITGWIRPPGSVRRHLWDGPRGDGPLLSLAASVDVSTSVSDGEAVATVTTTNVGAGHAIPTGEPMRSLILVVEATCDGQPLVPSGGDVVPAFGDALDTKTAAEDWSEWPRASVGDRVRVIARSGFRDYVGPGRFGDGSFDTAGKGLPAESWRGESTIVAVDGAQVTFDAPLPAGDVAYRVDGAGLPVDGEPSRAWAGAPGFAFARVLVDASGETQVPHHRAVDIQSDNRLMPLASVTTTHRFASPCDDPRVTARLVHRPYPLLESRRRGWTSLDQVMAEGTR